MPTEVQLKDGTKLRLRGDNLTAEQVQQKVQAFRAQRQGGGGEMQLATPEQGGRVSQRIPRGRTQKPRATPNMELATRAGQAQPLPFDPDNPDPDVFLARRGPQLEALQERGGQVTAGPVAPNIKAEQAASLKNAVPEVLRDRVPDRLIGPSTAQAVTAGLSDEAAGLASLATGGGFQEGAQAERQRIESEELQMSPGERAAITIAGSLASAGPSGGARAVLEGTSKLFTKTPGMLGSAAQGGKAGLVFGGISEGGRAEGGLGERAAAAGRGAVSGGVTGAGLGFGLPALFNGISKSLSVVGNRVSANTRNLTGRERNAFREVMKAFEEDGINAAEARRRLSEWAAQGGEPAALFDIGGPAVERLARRLGGKISRSASRLQNEVDRRLANQADEVAENLARTVSRETNYAQAVEDLDTYRKSLAAPLYEQAYGQTVKVTPELRRLLRRDAVNRAVPRARRIASNEDTSLEELGLVRNADGTFEFADEVDVRLIDYLKRGIDRDLNKRFRDSTTGRLNVDDESRGILNTKSAILEQADKQVPVYADAREVWSSTADTIEALALGKDIFKPSLNADMLAKRVRGMKEGDKEYLRAGVVRAIMDKVENTPDGANAVKKFFNREAFRKKLRLIFDDTAQMENFEALMRRQLDKIDRTQRVSPRFGSQTQPRQADVLEGGASAAKDLLRGDVGKAVTGGLTRTVVRSFRDKRAQALQDEENEAVFELLFNRDSPTAILEQARRFAPELATQRAGSAAARPGSEVLRRAVDDVTANQSQ